MSESRIPAQRYTTGWEPALGHGHGLHCPTQTACTQKRQPKGEWSASIPLAPLLNVICREGMWGRGKGGRGRARLGLRLGLVPPSNPRGRRRAEVEREVTEVTAW